MPEIGKWSLYDIDDLIETWKHGWRALAELAEHLSLRTRTSSFFGNIHSTGFLSDRIFTSFCEVFHDMQQSRRALNCVFPQWLLDLAGTPKNESFAETLRLRAERSRGIHRTNEKKDRKAEIACRRYVGKVIGAFAKSATVNEAFSKIGTTRQREEFLKCFDSPGLQELMATEIRGHWAEVMNWLYYGLSGEKACEEAYWNCIWCYLEPDIGVLLEIKNRINQDMPLTDDQYSLLNGYMSAGFPQGYQIKHESGKGEMYELVLEPEGSELIMDKFALAASQFLAQPAFSLAGELQRRCAKPRFVRQCRAPSCGKMFYTGREDATACPGNRGDKKNKCALEWIRYKRWMQKTGRAPEKDWDNDDFKRQFISSDND